MTHPDERTSPSHPGGVEPGQDARCLLCGAAEHRIEGRPDALYTLLRCNSCGFVYASPRPDEAMLQAFYNQHTDYNADPPPLTPAKAKARAARYAGFIRRFHPGARRVLEIGCLHAHLLHGLRQWGHEVQGADICESARHYARRAYGITVHPGGTPPEELAGSYDVIILAHVIEHVLDPVAFLEGLARFLAPGGILLVETPGLDTPLYSLFKAAYNMVRPPEHISFFDARTLREALRLAGLERTESLTYSPGWDQKNVFMYGALSLFKALGVLSALRKGGSSSTDFGLAAPIAVRPGGLFAAAFRAADLGCRLLNIALTPLVRAMDSNGRGLMLVAVGRAKPTDTP
ncbi:putative S-adenosylmethionine-dependent methyltransferase/MSMEI_2290 [Fundidesulfovibrio magnetotacticus]|uniref:Putative S-adenosylmethionine-dependent methyltransferase/MSMEI_2290 n=1 Tax=Fundidesulfovibrio magnetotacticus TaxID=2730080 RepID=A0A6V8LPK4_9BACT|nr:class I SAM-dependent methyltransferase [Fundidesulfovibrio magnetotacticus]GFK92920.1 putative S-adenosylmethionine-dependent methyltransferase/MSMEI_2290 [Fundidesulfovibrio magnetotacticus]